MAVVRVPENKEEEYLQQFFMASAFTFEGLKVDDKMGMKMLEKHMREAGFPEDEDFIVYHLPGSVMNKHYNLTGENAYPDDLTIAVIPNFYNPVFRLSVGARWFDDIVESNSREQEKINEKQAIN